MDINLVNFKLSVTTIYLGIYILIATILYVLIFYKHHKRNNLNYVEISEIYMKYIVLFTLSIVILIFAFDMFLTGLEAIEFRRERYSNLIIASLIVSGVIWNFIRFIKLNLKDIEKGECEEIAKKTIKVGEVLQLIFFVIIILTPIWRIPNFISLINNIKEMFIQIGISFFYSIIGLFLLFRLNPLNFKDKLK